MHEKGDQTMNAIESIKQVIKARRMKGASRESISQYLDHLKNETWKGCPNVCQEIQKIQDNLCRIKKEQSGQTQLFDVSTMFTLSGDQPVKQKTFTPPIHEQKTALFGPDTMKRDHERMKRNG